MGSPESFPSFLDLSCVTFGRQGNLSGPPFPHESKSVSSPSHASSWAGTHPGTLVLALNWSWLVSAAPSLGARLGWQGSCL